MYVATTTTRNGNVASSFCHVHATTLNVVRILILREEFTELLDHT